MNHKKQCTEKNNLLENEILPLLLSSDMNENNGFYEFKGQNGFSAGLLIGESWNQYQNLLKEKDYDELTGLPSLSYFKKQTKKLLKENPSRKYAIVYSDLSRIKYFNDTFGYDIGDKILCDLAQLFKSHLREHEFLARISQDNFLSLVRYEQLDELRQDILKLNEKFNRLERVKYPGNSFVIISGVAPISTIEELNSAIDNANLARKSVKNSLKAACKIFDEELKMTLLKEAEITNDMEQALKNKEFVVYYQPKYKINTNQLVGAEALVRWRRNGNLISPVEFIPIFEKNGFIVNVDFYVYEEVCKMLHSRLKKQLPVIPISINVSRVHLNDEDFVKKFEILVDSYEIPHEYLELELTETVLLDNTLVAIDIMQQLRKKGFSVSIDDFGSGYSSLNLLKDINTDILKIDKEFFSQGEMKREEKIIVSSIINMAKQLNMKVVSEGVKTKKQFEFLRSIGCDMAQGYLFSMPIPVTEFEAMI